MNSNAGVFSVDAQGNIYSFIYQFATYEEGDETDKIYLECNTPDGTKQWEIHLNEKVTEGDYYYVSSIYCDEKNQVIVDSSRGIEVYDNQERLNDTVCHEQRECWRTVNVILCKRLHEYTLLCSRIWTVRRNDSPT